MKLSSFYKTIVLIPLLLLISAILHAGYYEEGCRYFSNKKYDKAREMFEKSIEISDDGNSYYFMGEMEKNEGNFDKAEEFYRTAVTKRMIGKYKKLAYWNLIVFQEQKGKYHEMVVACRELWDAMRDEAARKKAEVLINKFLWTENDEAKQLYVSGVEYKKKNANDKAREAFYNAMRIDSSFLAPRFEIGLMLFNENDTSRALSYFKEIIERIPFYGEVHLLIGEIYFNDQSYSNSITHLGKAREYGFLDSKIKYSLRLKMGTSYYELGELEKAQEEYLAAADQNKKDSEPLLMLSAIYIKKNSLEQAVAVLLKARELNPDNTEILFQIGSILYKMNDQKYAQYFSQLFNKYYALKESIPQKYHRAISLLFRNYYDNKKFEEAARVFESLPESQKNNETALMAARAYFYSGKHEKAVNHFEKLSLANDDRYLQCISYAKTGMEDKARDILLALSDINGYLAKAKSEYAIRKIAIEIEKEKIKKEEAIKKAVLEEKKSIEEEKLREEKLKEEKLRAEADSRYNKEEKPNPEPSVSK